MNSIIDKVFVNYFNSKCFSLKELDTFLYHETDDFHYCTYIALYTYNTTVKLSFFNKTYFTNPKTKIYRYSSKEVIKLFKPLNVNKKEHIVLDLKRFAGKGSYKKVLDKDKYKKTWWLLPYNKSYEKFIRKVHNEYWLDEWLD